ncbi:quinate 5-dehydrogenase [Calorimonas adulescens]|uniref:Quinate 5-dehydrogenase n=1 Tax=Calorimonas adulescens TaxID=2606906 RepID=A0A5D8QBP4_9THEO|nr:quinate 5-dehydrogenase [Calorimonas adulescens]TZE81569.1 quinate 5-dehydrogenase [Calorimonas adulescens]
MKRVVSISIGSSTRDHKVETEFLGQKFEIQRIGTDGDIKKAVEMIRELDGKVDAFGMGGIDLYLRAGKKKYIIRDALPLKNAAKITPIVDGSGLKDTLERRVIEYVDREVMPLKGRHVLLVSGLDRFGMAQTFEKLGCDLILGDAIFALGIPMPVRSLKMLYFLASILMPVLSRLPFEVLYPTGEKQEFSKSKHEKYYQWADIIAGDYLFIKRYMPDDLNDKVIITNTVTAKDVDELKKRGIRTLVTTTPELNGRSFGTNVMEGVLITLAGKRPEDMSPEDYREMLDRIGFTPRVEMLKTV